MFEIFHLEKESVDITYHFGLEDLCFSSYRRGRLSAGKRKTEKEKELERENEKEDKKIKLKCVLRIKMKKYTKSEKVKGRREKRG